MGGPGGDRWLLWGLLDVGIGGLVVSAGLCGDVLDCGGQRNDFLGQGLVDGGEDGDLKLEFGDFVSQGSKMCCYCCLYLGQGVFQAVVVIV